MYILSHVRKGQRKFVDELDSRAEVSDLLPHNLKKAEARATWEESQFFYNTWVKKLESLKGEPMGNLYLRKKI